MKRSNAPSVRFGALAVLMLGALSCGLDEHPQGSGEPPADPDPGSPGPGSTEPGVTPPPAITPTPAGGTPMPMPMPMPMPGPVNPLPPSPTPGMNPVPAPPPAPNPVPTGPGVTINGTFVPKDKAIVVIHWGHSNMYGQARSPTSLRPFFFESVPDVWSYRGGGRYVPAKEKTAPSPNGDSNANAGPGMAILRTLAAAAPAGAGYHIISIGRGQGSATTAQYLKGGLYYSTFMDLAMQLKGKVTFAGVFIMMGITDRHMPLGEQSGFAERTSRIIADMRADLGEPDLPMLHTDYEVTSTGSLSISTDFARRIRPLMLSLPERVRNLAIIPCDDIPLEDDHHFTLEGHKLWAERGVEIMRERGWMPWIPASAR